MEGAAAAGSKIVSPEAPTSATFQPMFGWLTPTREALAWLFREGEMKDDRLECAQMNRTMTFYKGPVDPSVCWPQLPPSRGSYFRTTLAVCCGEKDGVAFGHELFGDHPLVPAGMGDPMDERWVAFSDPTLLKQAIICSVLYTNGYMAMATYMVHKSGTEITLNSIVRQDRPDEILFQLQCAERLVFDTSKALTAPSDHTVWDRVLHEVSQHEKGARDYMIQCFRKDTAGKIMRSNLLKPLQVFSMYCVDDERHHDMKVAFCHLKMVGRPIDRLLGRMDVGSKGDWSRWLSSNAKICTTSDHSNSCDDGSEHNLYGLDGLSRDDVGADVNVSMWKMDIKSGTNPCTEIPGTVAVVQAATRNGAQGSDLVCPECFTVFKRKYEMKRHLETIHNGVRRFICHVCNKAFSQAAHVRVHIETVHEKRRSEECDLCGLKFGTKHKRDRHRRAVHDRERSYVCPVCQKAYFQNSDLKRHYRQHHETSAPNGC